jgi:hypothetical protein
MHIANPNDKNLDGISVKQPMGLDSNTLVLMVDHSSKAIGSLKVGDVLFLGGKVTNVINDDSQNIHNYKGLFCTGNMKVLENGRWILVEESAESRRHTNNEPYTIAIPQSETLLFMTTDYQVWSSNLRDVTEELNTKHKLNALLSKSAMELK